MVEGWSVYECWHLFIFIRVSGVLDQHTHAQVCSCWSWLILLGPSVVTLWRVYLKAQNRWSVWNKILPSVTNAGTSVPPALWFHPLAYPEPFLPFPSFTAISITLFSTRSPITITLDCDLTKFISGIYVCQCSFCPRETTN